MPPQLSLRPAPRQVRAMRLQSAITNGDDAAVADSMGNYPSDSELSCVPLDGADDDTQPQEEETQELPQCVEDRVSEGEGPVEDPQWPR